MKLTQHCQSAVLQCKIKRWKKETHTHTEYVRDEETLHAFPSFKMQPWVSTLEFGFMKMPGRECSSTDLQPSARAHLLPARLPFLIILSWGWFRLNHCACAVCPESIWQRPLAALLLVWWLRVRMILASGKQAILFCVYLFINISFQKRFKVAYKNV